MHRGLILNENYNRIGFTKMEIRKPCEENWEGMKIGLHARFCDQCNKNVIDFTMLSRNQIIAYLLENKQEKICARVQRSQLDFSNTDFAVTVQALKELNRNRSIPLLVFSLGAIVLSSCDAPITDQEKNKNINSTSVTKSADSVIKDSIDGRYTKDIIPKKESDSVLSSDVTLLGEVDFCSDTLLSQEVSYLLVDVMPEFKGGVDSLRQFILKNLTYPDWEKKNKIEGTVVVSFIVSKTGKVSQAVILRSVKGARNFDKEVLRIIQIMPDWIPGKHKGEEMDVQINLPLNFIL